MDGMKPGNRQHLSASCKVKFSKGLPSSLRGAAREIVEVTAGTKGKRHAAGLLDKVCREADIAKLMLMVHVKAYGEGLTDKQLEIWYTKLGFETIQREPSVLMVRLPKQTNGR
jgi:hypothetical protein